MTFLLREFRRSSMKMPKKNSSSPAAPNSAAADSPNRCAFETSDGRRCRMLRHRDHPSLCIFHARDEMQLLESARLGSELSASISGNFLTATDVNFVLGKLFKALAQKRISHREAATLAYIGQLMLHSHHNVKREYQFEYQFEQWKRMLCEARRLSDFAPPAVLNPSPDRSPTTTSVPAVSSNSNANPDANAATGYPPQP
jgi:hypothetical protein